MAFHKKESFDRETTEGLMERYKDIITLLGEDAEREGLIKTPELKHSST